MVGWFIFRLVPFRPDFALSKTKTLDAILFLDGQQRKPLGFLGERQTWWGMWNQRFQITRDYTLTLDS